MKNNYLRLLLGMMCLVMVPGISQAQSTKGRKTVSASLRANTAVDKGPDTPLIKRLSARDVKAFMDSSTTPLIVNFWATWCGPCIREIPWFDSIIAAKKAPVHLLLVNLDFPEAYPHQLERFLKKHAYKGEVVYLGETNANYFIPIIAPKWSGAIPASVFINNTKKYYEVFNYQLTAKRFELELEKLIN